MVSEQYGGYCGEISLGIVLEANKQLSIDFLAKCQSNETSIRDGVAKSFSRT